MSVKELQGVVDDFREQAAKRAADLLGEGRTEVRRAVGGHSDGTVLGMFALGIVLGAVVGAAIALLFAPISGGLARRKIVESVDRVRMGESAATDGETRPMPSASTPPYVSS